MESSFTSVAATFAAQNWTGVSSERLIRSARATFQSNGLVMASHFDEESALMLHLMTRGMSDIPVIHIKESSSEPPPFMGPLIDAFKPNLHVFETTGDKREALYRAVQTLNADGVFFGIRAYQSETREAKQPVEFDGGGTRPFCRLHPVLAWSVHAVAEYFETHNLPRPPGYIPGTRVQKNECGLHHSRIS